MLASGVIVRRREKSPSTSHDAGTTDRVAELYLCTLILNYGFEVFQPLVDVGVDFLAYNQRGSLLRIQSKSRSQEEMTVFDLSPPKSRKVESPTHVIYARGRMPTDDHWLVPYSVVKRLASKISGPRGRKILRIVMSKPMQRRFRDFYREEGFEAARGWKP